MKRDFRDKWVADLRSGKYKQATGVLCALQDDNPEDTSHRCCLGVAMNSIGVPPTITENWVTLGYTTEQQYLDEEGGDKFNVDFDNQNELPDADQLVKMGITSEIAKELSSMNDGSFNNRSCSFEEIADYIMTLPVED